MRISDMLTAIASWLESPNNEAMLLAEYHEDSAQVVAESCVLAAALLKNAAEQVGSMEPPEPSKITPESIEEIAALAAAFDASGDVGLKKQASVLDELLLSIAAPPNALAQAKDSDDKRIDTLKKKYEDPSKELREVNKIADSEKAIEKSDMTKNYRIMEAPLSTRYCPDHPGVQISRVGEHMWQCELDKKSYNFETGFELNNGAKVPGGDVNQQTQGVNIPYHAIFDTREGRLGAKNASADENDMKVIRRRPVVQEVENIPQAGFSTNVSPGEEELPEFMGEDAGKTDPAWLGMKEITNSQAWKDASRDERIAMLEALKNSLNEPVAAE